MDYKNFIIRFAFSVLLFLLYLITLTSNKLLFSLVLVIYLIIFYETIIYFRKYIILILLYLLISLYGFIYYYLNYFNLYIFNLLVLSIIIFDTFSYIIGSFIGRLHIFKNISPNKTLEGFIGGLLVTNIIFLAYNLYFFDLINFKQFILINLIIFFAFIGDLIQSIFKRKNSLKNSSNFLPGHGGFFDRFDSFISSIVLLSIYSYIFF